MSEQFYIITEDGEQGPFDILNMMRKIKNRNLAENGMVRVDGMDAAVPAKDVGALKEFFLELPPEDVIEAHEPSEKIYDLRELFDRAVQCFQLQQPGIVIQSGMFLLIAALLTGIFSSMGIYVGTILAFVSSFVVLSGLFFVMLKRSRGQSINTGDAVGAIKANLMQLIMASLVISVPFSIGMLLLIAPGLIVLTLYLFVPFLVMDRGMGYWDAMETSRKKVMSMDLNNVGVVFALVVANVFAAVLFLLPLIASLPLTLHAAAEIYDEQFS